MQFKLDYKAILQQTGKSTLDVFKQAGMNIIDDLSRGIGLQDNEDNKEQEDLNKIPASLKKGKIKFGKVGWNTVYFTKHRHKLIKGATDCGKTTFGMGFAINTPTGVCYLDNADGLAVDRILKSLPFERLDKTILLDYSDTNYIPPVGTVEHSEDIFKQDIIVEQWIEFFKSHFGTKELYRTESLITYACMATFGIEGTSILDVVKLVKSKSYREQILNKLDTKYYKDVIQWWIDYDNNSDSKQRHISEAFETRAGLLQKDHLLKYALGQKPKEELNYRKWMDEGYTVLIKVPDSLGKQRVNIIMSLHVLGFWQAALSRDDIPESKRKAFYIIADEPQSWLTNNETTFDNIYSKARKYKMYMCSLFQSYKQLPSGIVNILLDNRPDIIDFSTDDKDIKLKQYEFLCTMRNINPFIAKSLGPAKFKRNDISGFVYLMKKRFNKHYEEIQNELDRRDFHWEITQKESQKNTSKQKSNQELQRKTEKSLNSSTVKGW